MKNQKSSARPRPNPVPHQGFNQQHSRRFSLGRLINAFFYNFFGAIPFSVRMLMRREIGGMTFSWVKILFAALWVRFILDGLYDMDGLTPPETFMYSWFNKGQGMQYFLALFGWYIGIFFHQLGSVIINFVPYAAWMSSPDGDFVNKETFAFLVSISVLAIGINHKIAIGRLHDKHIFFNPMDKGSSWIFNGLIKFINPPNPEQALLFLEIGLLLVFSYASWLFENAGVLPLHFSRLFLLGAIGLWVEYLIERYQKRRELEIRFANEFKAIELQSLYQEYRKEISDDVATVSYPYAASTHSPKPSSKPTLKTDYPQLKKLHPTIAHLKNRAKQISNKMWGAILIGIISCIVIFSSFKEEDSSTDFNQYTEKPYTVSGDFEHDAQLEFDNILSATSVASDFINFLGNKDFESAYQLQEIDTWGSLDRFSSTKTFGGITHTKVLEIPTIVRYTAIDKKGRAKVKIRIKYLAVDPANDTCEDGAVYEQYFWAENRDKIWRIVHASLENTYCH